MEGQPEAAVAAVRGGARAAVASSPEGLRRSKRRRVQTSAPVPPPPRPPVPQEVVVIDSDDSDNEQPQQAPARAAAVRAAPSRVDVVDVSNEDDDEPEVVEIRATPARSSLAAVARMREQRAWERARISRTRQRETEELLARLRQRHEAARARNGTAAAGGGRDVRSIILAEFPIQRPGGQEARRGGLHPGHARMPFPVFLMLGGLAGMGNDFFAQFGDMRAGPTINNGATAQQIDAIPTHVLPDSKKRAREDDEEGKEEEEATCIICMDPFKPGQTVSTLPCGHEYHTKCINEWLKRNKTCCLCKREIA